MPLWGINKVTEDKMRQRFSLPTQMSMGGEGDVGPVRERTGDGYKGRSFPDNFSSAVGCVLCLTS